eukprot:scaffold8683_cov79-Skeletonema_dohrnii-CCMP3373.AAC.3
MDDSSCRASMYYDDLAVHHRSLADVIVRCYIEAFKNAVHDIILRNSSSCRSTRLGSEGNCTILVVGLGGGGGVRSIVDSFLTGVRRMDADDDDDGDDILKGSIG